MDEIAIRQLRGPEEYPRLVQVWRSAVEATHDFLAEEHRASIEGRLAAEYFPHVVLTVADREGVPVGFAGTVGGNLEMLFVEAAHRGRGITGDVLPQLPRRKGAVLQGAVVYARNAAQGAIFCKIFGHVQRDLYIINSSVFFVLPCRAAKGGASCGHCSHHGPVGAIRMVHSEQYGHHIPVIAEEQCIGCGACEYLCPSNPVSAITVDGLSIHRHN